MAINVLIEVQTKEGQADALINFLKQIFPDTRKYDGFIDIYASQNQDNSNTILLVQEWESKPHYESYLQWRTERGDFDKLGSFLTGSPSIRYFDKSDA